jgi:hypothetical protein
VIINDFNILNVTLQPDKTDAPLAIDTDTPLPGTITGKLFKSVAGWHAEKVECSRGVKLCQLALRGSLYIWWQLFGEAAPEQPFRIFTGEGLDHE